MILKRLLLTAEAGAGGDPNASAGAGTGAPAAGGGTPANGTGAPWYASAESLKTSDPDVWTSFEKGVQSGNHKDLATLVKHTVGLEKKLGTTLTMPNKDNPQEVAAFKEKMIGAGIYQKPPVIPESPDKYEVKLDAIPEAMRAEPTVKALKDWAHKNGVTNEAVNELIGIEMQRYADVVQPALKYTTEQAQKAINDFAAEIGKEPDVVAAYGGAWLTKHFSPEEIEIMEQNGFANSPLALKYAARAGIDTGEDISVIAGAGSAGDQEFDTFMKDLFTKGSDKNKLWMNGDPQNQQRVALQAKFDELNKKKYGTGEAK